MGEALLRLNGNSDYSLNCGVTKLPNFTVLSVFCSRILKLLSQFFFQSLSELIKDKNVLLLKLLVSHATI